METMNFMEILRMTKTLSEIYPTLYEHAFISATIWNNDTGRLIEEIQICLN